MKKTIEQLHLAAQYLAGAGFSFLVKRDDDSHGNLAWNSAQSRLETHVFGHEDQLALNLNTTQLEWLKNGKTVSTIDLQGSLHSDILAWIVQEVSNSGITETYKYTFHYDLPYPAISANDTFTFDPAGLKEFSNRLNIGQQAFEAFLATNNLESPIRVWPHHFDLGIYTSLKADGTFFMGAGLAVSDSLMDDMYYYVSGYNNGKAVVTKDLSGLTKGDWRADWNGATLDASQVDKDTAIRFLNEGRNGVLGGG